MKRIVTILVLLLIYKLSLSQEWDGDFNGIDSLWNESPPSSINAISILDMYNYNDTILYLGGGFAYVNESSANSFASWNTDTIRVYQEGVDWGGVDAIIKYKDTLYIGGSFNTASGSPNTTNIAVWNGSNWQSTNLGQADSDVHDFCIYHDTLFVAGNFGHIGALECNKIAAYNGEEWINVGSMGMWTKALAVFNDELYAGGYWGVRKYLGGAEWETFNPGPNGYVNELMVDTINSLLLVGGEFSHIGEEVSVCSAIWDGFNWISTGWGGSTTIWPQASAYYRGEFYTGNGAVIEDDVWTFWIRKWNGEAWDSIGGTFDSTISSLEVFRDTLYIGGYFAFWGGDSPVPDKRNKGMVKLFMPENGCDYLKPRINAYTDTFYLNNGEAVVNLYNNNPYADSWDWDFGDSQTGDIKDPVHTYTQVGEYNVQVTVSQEGCVKTANKTIYIELGSNSNIQNYENIQMQVFPNPSSNGFTLKTSLPNYKNAEIKIVGLNGHLKDIISVTSETTVIPTKGWKPGAYVCNLFVDGKLVKAEKLIYE
ncbi:MAG: PKD domain-containing protein [Bacteroidales bacterium]|nr:PKD domain-containing protein [Bacteroidales bacterium]